jgi:hypothetical protein
MARAAKPAPAPIEPVVEPTTLPEKLDPIPPEPEPEIEPDPVPPEPEPDTGGSLTPGEITGIPVEPETPAEHEARLGEAAGTFSDVGYTLGTLEPRPSWPAMPAEPVEPAPPADLVLTLSHIDPGTTKAHFELENAIGPVTYSFGDGTSHTPVGYDTAHTYAAAGSYTVGVLEGEPDTGRRAVIDIEIPEPEAVT